MKSPGSKEIVQGRPVFTERRGAVLRITIDRPERANAIDGEVTRGLAAALAELNSEDGLRAGLLTATGDGHFCVGSDLRAAEQDALQLMHPVGGFGGMVRFPRTKPLVAAINGDAIGGGIELALACDFAIAADTARFAFPEVGIGVIAGAGGAIRLPSLIGPVRAMDLLLTGRSIGAAEAAAIGLIARAVPAQDLADEAMRAVESIAASSAAAVSATRELVTEATALGGEELWRRNDAVLARILNGPDAAEGRRAFLEKRLPRWTSDNHQ
jgi:enoyl-CoA hydratase